MRGMRVVGTILIVCTVFTATPNYAAQQEAAGAVAGDTTQPQDQLLQPIPIELIVGYKSLAGSPAFSSDGKLLAVTLFNGHKRRPLPEGENDMYLSTGVPNTWSAAEIWIKDLGSGDFTQLNAPASANWGASWSPDGQRLAFFSDLDGAARVWVWDRKTGRAARVCDAILRTTQADDKPGWLDGTHLIAKFLGEGVSLTQATDDAKWRKGPKIGETDALTLTVASEHSNVLRLSTGDLGVIDMADGSVNRIARELNIWSYRPSPDGSLVAFDVWSGSGISDFYIVTASDGTRKLALEKRTFGPAYGWSADSRYLAYKGGYIAARADDKGETGGVLFDAHSGQSTALPKTEGKIFTWAGERNELYVGQGAMLLQLAVQDGKVQETARLSLPLPIKQIVEDSRGYAARLGNNANVVVVGTADGGYSKADLRKQQHALLQARREDSALSHLAIRPRSDNYVFALGDETRYADLWLMKGGKVQRVTTLNPEMDRYVKGRARMIQWTDAQGRQLSGALLMPAGYQKGKRYPMLVDVYGGRDPKRGLRKMGFGGDYAEWNYQVLATRGYVVFHPEAPYGENTLMKDLADAVLSGVDKVIELGIADPEQLAVAGQSFGGYCVRALLVQTDRFKAGISTAGVSGNLFAHYPGGLHQHSITVDPFGGRDVFIRNSPYFAYDKINAALLIQIGMNDGIGNNPETYRDYFVLRELKRDVDVLEYYGEGHVMLGYSNLVDFWNRRIAWLDKYL